MNGKIIVILLITSYLIAVFLIALSTGGFNTRRYEGFVLDYLLISLVLALVIFAVFIFVYALILGIAWVFKSLKRG